MCCLHREIVPLGPGYWLQHGDYEMSIRVFVSHSGADWAEEERPRIVFEREEPFELCQLLYERTLGTLPEPLAEPGRLSNHHDHVWDILVEWLVERWTVRTEKKKKAAKKKEVMKTRTDIPGEALVWLLMSFATSPKDSLSFTITRHLDARIRRLRSLAFAQPLGLDHRVHSDSDDLTDEDDKRSFQLIATTNPKKGILGLSNANRLTPPIDGKISVCEKCTDGEYRSEPGFVSYGRACTPVDLRVQGHGGLGMAFAVLWTFENGFAGLEYSMLPECPLNDYHGRTFGAKLVRIKSTYPLGKTEVVYNPGDGVDYTVQLWKIRCDRKAAEKAVAEIGRLLSKLSEYGISGLELTGSSTLSRWCQKFQPNHLRSEFMTAA